MWAGNSLSSVIFHMVSYIMLGIITLEGPLEIQHPHICLTLFVHSVPPQGKKSL